MPVVSMLAIYILFWALSFFIVLPFRPGVKERGAEQSVPGQAESAPAAFNLGRAALWTTGVSLLLFALWYSDYRYDWLPASALDFYSAHRKN
jgi:predicted secreted protein